MELTKVIDLIQNENINDLELKFNAAVECIDIVKLIIIEQGTDLGINDKLKLYGLYKQAIFGDNTAPKPGISLFNPLESAAMQGKWMAWNKLKGTSKQDAKTQYIQVAIEMAEKYSQLVMDVDFCDDTLIEKRHSLGIEFDTPPTAIDTLVKKFCVDENLQADNTATKDEEHETKSLVAPLSPAMLNQFEKEQQDTPSSNEDSDTAECLGKLRI